MGSAASSSPSSVGKDVHSLIVHGNDYDDDGDDDIDAAAADDDDDDDDDDDAMMMNVPIISLDRAFVVFNPVFSFHKWMVEYLDGRSGWVDGCTDGWMGGWTDGWVDGRTDGWMDGWTDGWMDGWMDGWVDGWTDGWMDGWMDGWVDGWTDGWMGGWMDGRVGGRMGGWMERLKKEWMDPRRERQHLRLHSSRTIVNNERKKNRRNEGSRMLKKNVL